MDSSRFVSGIFIGRYVIVNSSVRHAFEKNGGSGRKYTTVLVAISAAGQVLPPFIIYSGKVLMDNWCKRGPTGAHYGVTDSVNIDIPMLHLFGMLKINLMLIFYSK